MIELKVEIERLIQERDEKAKLLQRDSKYHEFLKSVISLRGDGDPENIDALMKRYENLKNHRNRLGEQIERKKLELNEKRKKHKEDNEVCSTCHPFNHTHVYLGKPGTHAQHTTHTMHIPSHRVPCCRTGRRPQ